MPGSSGGIAHSNEAFSPLPELPGFRIIRELGRGGMGIVYEAEDLALGRRVALKIIPHTLLDNDLAIRRFDLEARTNARLHHDHIVPVYQVGQAAGLHFFTMRLIEGRSLDKVIRDLREQMQLKLHESNLDRRRVLSQIDADLFVPSTHVAMEDESATSDMTLAAQQYAAPISNNRTYYRQVAEIGHQIALALSYAHANGVVHRDIKPSNMLLDTDERVWVTDFGLAKIDNSDDLTRTGMFVGTLRFMAPERLEGICDRRSDVYSLGMTLYEMLALAPAFAGGTQYKLMQCIREFPPRPLKSIDPAIPRDLQTIIETALAKSPSRRYQTAGIMAEDLELFLEGRPIRARRVSRVERICSWVRRNPALAIAVSLVNALIIAGLIVAMIAAVHFRDMALEQAKLTGLADQATQFAKRQSELNAENLYNAEMMLAIDASKSPTGLRRLRELLGHWKPDVSVASDRRGFEWFWLASIAWPEHRKINEGFHYFMEWNTAGNILCWGCGDGWLHVSSWPELQELARLPFPEHAELIALSVDGKKVATITDEGKFSIWDWSRQESTTPEAIGEKRVTAMAWSHDGGMYAITLSPRESKDRLHVQVYSATDGRLLSEVISEEDLKGPYRESRLEFSFDDRWLAAACSFRDQHLAIIDALSWKIRQVKSFAPCHDVRDFAWHPSQYSIALATTDGQVFAWSLGDEGFTRNKFETFMTSVGWRPDGSQVALTGNGSIRMLNPETLSLEEVVYINEGNDTSVAIHPAGEDWIGSGLDCGTFVANRRDRSTVVLPKSMKTSPDGGGRIDWSHDGKWFATSAEPPAKIWSSFDYKPLIHKENYSVLGKIIGWLEDGSVVYQYQDKLIVSDDEGKSTRDTIVLPIIDENVLAAVAVSPCRRKILLTGNQYYQNWSLSVWKQGSDVVEEVIPLQKGRVFFRGAWSPDGRQIALGIGDRLVIVDVEQKRIVRDQQIGDIIFAAAWSHDGTLLATAGRHRNILIWQTDDFRQVGDLHGHTGTIHALAWSPDDTRLASGSDDGAVRLWDPRSGKCTSVFQGDSSVTSVAWSPDGNRLASGDHSGTTVIRDSTRAHRLKKSE